MTDRPLSPLQERVLQFLAREWPRPMGAREIAYLGESGVRCSPGNALRTLLERGLVHQFRPRRKAFWSITAAGWDHLNGLVDDSEARKTAINGG